MKIRILFTGLLFMTLFMTYGTPSAAVNKLTVNDTHLTVNNTNLPAAGNNLYPEMGTNPVPAPSADHFSQPDRNEMFAFLTRKVRELDAYGKGTGKRKEGGLNFGTAYDRIDTIGGTVIWTGWDGSFSETYAPQSETYAWVVYYGGQGMFVALQWAKSAYSSVDVFMGLDAFCGALTSPDGDYLLKSHIAELSGVSISFDTSLPQFYGLGIGASLGTTFFRKGSAKTLEDAVQFTQGYNISYSLTAPIPLPSIPISVALDYESGVEAGFFPIVDWSLIPVPETATPLEYIIAKLKGLQSLQGDDFLTLNSRETAAMLLPFMETLEGSSIGDLNGNSHVSNAAAKVEEWLRAEDPDELGPVTEALIPPLSDFLPAARQMGKVQAATGLGFEIGYKHGYDSSGRDTTVYGDCLETIETYAGKTCTVEVTTLEIASLVPGSVPEDFKEAWVYFDTPPGEWYRSEEKGVWAQVSEGKALYEFVPESATTVIMGVQVEKSTETGEKTLELCRRKIIVKDAPKLTVDIKAEGSDTPVTIPAGAPVSIALALTPDTLSGTNAEWWLYADTPEGRRYWILPGVWQPGETPTLEHPLMELPLTPLINELFTAGDYTFHFCVDTLVNGRLDETWKDSVSVSIR